MAALPRRQREVLALRYYLDLSEREIAETLGISPGAVKSHASRGAEPFAVPCPHCSRSPHDRPDHPNDGDLRALLDDAVSDVHPEVGPEQVRSRARRPRPHAGCRSRSPQQLRRRWSSAVVTGSPSDSPRGTPPAAGTPSTAPASKGAGRTGSHRGRGPFYFVGATAGGPRLFPEARHSQRTRPDNDAAGRGGRGPSGHPNDPDYESAWPLPGTTAAVDHEREADHRGPHPFPRSRPTSRKGAGERATAGSRVDRGRRRRVRTCRCSSPSGASPATLLGVDASAPDREERAPTRSSPRSSIDAPTAGRRRSRHEFDVHRAGRHLRGQRGLGA